MFKTSIQLETAHLYDMESIETTDSVICIDLALRKRRVWLNTQIKRHLKQKKTRARKKKRETNTKFHLNHTSKYFGPAPLLFSGAVECDCQTF